MLWKHKCVASILHILCWWLHAMPCHTDAYMTQILAGTACVDGSNVVLCRVSSSQQPAASVADGGQAEASDPEAAKAIIGKIKREAK